MNRKIAFRAWDVENEKMIQNYAHISEYGQFYTAWTSTDRERKYIPMQYTGLKDKNNKEIFEGDIIEWVNWSNNESKLITIIEYEDDYAAFFFGNWYERSFPETSEEALIIGNIYENPELLDRVEEIPIMKGTREALDKIVI